MSRYLYKNENEENILELDSRGFLNKDTGMAAYNVKAEISVDKWQNKDKIEERRLSNWCELTISDCTRQINLDFSIGDCKFDKDYENAVYKLERLRCALDEIEGFLDKVKEENSKIVPSTDET